MQGETSLTLTLTRTGLGVAILSISYCSAMLGIGMWRLSSGAMALGQEQG